MEMDSEVIEEKPNLLQNFQNVCRLCMSEEMLEDVFIFHQDDLIRRVFDLLSIALSEDDQISRSICAICRARLNEFHEYKLSCLQIQGILQGQAGLAGPIEQPYPSYEQILPDNPNVDEHLLEDIKVPPEIMQLNAGFSGTDHIERPAKKLCVGQTADLSAGPEQYAYEYRVLEESQESCSKTVSQSRLQDHVNKPLTDPVENLWSTPLFDVATEPQPPTKTKKVTEKRYSDSTLNDILQRVRNGELTVNYASCHYGIPRGTIQYRLSGRFKNKGTSGPCTMFNKQEEQDIANQLKEMERKGFPITRNSLRHTVCCFLKKHPRQLPSKNEEPGKGWYRGFMNRHTDLTLRNPQTIIPTGPKISENDIYEWFRTVKSYLSDNDLLSIFHDPSRILFGDEAGFYSNLATKGVLAAGKKNAPTFVEAGGSRQNMTVMFTFCADGGVIPPHVTLAQKKLNKELTKTFPKEWGLGISEYGWFDTKNFIQCMRKTVQPFLARKGVRFPVIYFVDGLKPQKAYEAAEICQKLGIILVALFPHATRILPLKSGWKSIVEVWKSSNMEPPITLYRFGHVLDVALKAAFKPCSITNGFKACGICPFNPDAVDYVKHFAVNDVCDDVSRPLVVESMELVPQQDETEEEGEEETVEHENFLAETYEVEMIKEDTCQENIFDKETVKKEIIEDETN